MPHSVQAHNRQTDIALLIDGDNAQPSLLDNLFVRISELGRVAIRRIYGDWTSPNMQPWKAFLAEHAITPIQQFRNVPGKNATDSALIIDAMDILHTHPVRCFCIVSSDSDFTRLATRIRESGVRVIGVGRASTPTSFQKACDLFLPTEGLGKVALEDRSASLATEKQIVPGSPQLQNLKVKTASSTGNSQPPYNKSARSTASTRKTQTSGPVPTGDAKTVQANKPVQKKPLPVAMLKEAYRAAAQNDQWITLSVLGTNLRKLDPEFTSRAYGFAQLSKLVAAASDDFATKGTPGTGVRYVRSIQA